MDKKDWKKWIFWFSFAVATIIVYKTIDSVYSLALALLSFLNVLMPFFMAILMAYILYIPCKKIENYFNLRKKGFLKRHSRGMSILIIYLLLVLLIYIGFRFILPSITDNIIELAKNLPNYYSRAIDYINNLDEDSLLVKLQLNHYINSLNEIKLDNILIKFVTSDNITKYIKGIVGATGFIFDLFVTIVVSIYMLLERNEIKEFVKKAGKAILDRKLYEYCKRYYNKTNGIFFSYIAGQIVDVFIVGIITSIAMVIMKVKYGALFGCLIGLFNIIPYFGAIIAVVITSLVTIFTGGIFKAIQVAIVIIILQQIDANIINPKILGNSLKLSPILIIFAVTIGGAYFGILGMFLGVPIIALLKVILNDYIDYKNSILE